MKSRKYFNVFFQALVKRNGLILIFYLILKFPVDTLGQNSQLGAAMPTIIPMSPEISSFMKFSSYPVNQFTGIPDISIPIFEIKTKDFVIPVSLKYHSSGIKVSDVASWVGLGWSLSPGGVISRKVMGVPDEKVFGLNVKVASSINQSLDDDYSYLKHVFDKDNSEDAEPDEFFYNFPGVSGKFYSPGNSEPFLIPNSPLKINKYISNTYRNLDSLIIINDRGESFHFGYALSPQLNYGSRNGIDPNSSWLLTKIRNNGKTDSILFTYQSAGFGVLNEDLLDYVSVNDHNCTSNTSCGVPIGQTFVQNYSETVSTVGQDIVNSEIDFYNGKIKFVLSQDNRTDRTSNFKSLDSILIFSKENPNVPLKYVVFHKSNFVNGTNKRLRLDSICFLDSKKVRINSYKFSYNTSVSLPDYLSRQKDFWGYFNAKPNLTLIPRQQIEYVTAGASELIWIGGEIDGREPDPNSMQAYILNSITYPEGGKTEFQYQTNSYNDGITNKFAGGLRIYKIINSTGNQVLSTTYKYGEDGNGRLNTSLNLYNFSSVTVNMQAADDGNGCYPIIAGWSRLFVANPSVDLNPSDGSPVVYQSVTEFNGEINSNAGKIIYEFSDTPDKQIILYGYHYPGVGREPIICTTRPGGQRVMYVDKSFERGLLLRKSTYRNINNSYKIVHKVENNYSFFNPITVSYTGLMVWKGDVYSGGFSGSYRSEYRYDNYEVYSGDNRIKYSAEYSYNLNDETKFIKKETFYAYNDSSHLQISEIKQDESSGSIRVKKIKYPTDYSTGIYPEMVNSNILSTVIEEEESINSSSTKIRNNYKKYFDKYFALELIDRQVNTNPWNILLRFNNYDNHGNILSLQKEYDIQFSYLYDQFNQPIAEFKNASNQVVNSLNPDIYQLALGNRLEQKRLRDALPEAQITFYTYKPLVGMTTKTDANGTRTNYEYDDFGRLKCVKNDDGNILKTYSYHLK